MFSLRIVDKRTTGSIRNFLVVPVLLLLITPAISSRQLIMEIFYVKYFWLALVAAILVPLLVIHTKRQPVTRADLLVVLFTVYIYIQSYLSPIRLTEHKKLDYFLLAALAYFGVKQLIVTNKYRVQFWVLIIIFLTTIVTALYGILQKVGLIIPFNDAFQITGTFFQPAAFAGFMAGIFPLACYSCYTFWKHDNSEPLVHVVKIMALILISLVIFILPSVQSRASILGLVAGLFYIAGTIEQCKLFIRRKMAKRRTWMILLIATGFLFVIVAGYRVRESSADGRLLAWKISGKMIQDKPLSGFGTDAFRYVYPDYQIAYFKSETRTENEKLLSCEINAPFNEFIQFCCEWGMIGLLFFLLIIIAVFRNTHSTIKNSAGLPAGLIGTVRTGAKAALVCWLVFSQFSYPFSLAELTVYFFIFLALSDGAPTTLSGPGRKQVFAIIRPVFIILLCCIIVARMLPIYKTWQGVQQWNKAIAATDPVSAHNAFMHAISLLNDNDLFLSDLARHSFKLGRYNESAEILHLKKGKLYNDLLLGGEICEKLSMQDSAVEYYKNASFLLPHRFLPIHKLMRIYESKGDLTAASAAAREILNKQVKFDSYEVYTIKNDAGRLLDAQKKLSIQLQPFPH